MRILHVASTLVLSLGLLHCGGPGGGGSDTGNGGTDSGNGGTDTGGGGGSDTGSTIDGLALTNGSITQSDPPNALVTQEGRTHVDAYTVRLNSSTLYYLQVCPAHVGWNPAITHVAPGATSQNSSCVARGDTGGVACNFSTGSTEAGLWTILVSDAEDIGTSTMPNRDYTLLVQNGAAGRPALCPMPANP